MEINVHTKSRELLETLANSVHDRNKNNPADFFFSISEMHVAEQWLNNFIKDIKKDCVCL